MSIHARFSSLDEIESLDLALRGLGFPKAAADLVGSSLIQGHLTVRGLSDELRDLCRTLLQQQGMPKMLEGTRKGSVLFSGKLAELKFLGMKLQERAELEGAVEAGGKILRACFYGGQRGTVKIGDRVAGGERTLVMGILNVTPDSFSDGGSYLEPSALLAQATRLVEAGADILDVGGESTRPRGLYAEGAAPVSADEERARVEPAVRLLRKEFPGVAISVDTSKAPVAEAAIGEGADLINDVRGLRDDDLARVVAIHGVPCCLMHMPAEPDEMARHTDYDDVVGEVADALCALAQRAQERGVRQDRILLDPGFGFGKTYGQSLLLLRELRNLRASVGRPLLVGTSRKGFLGHVTGRQVDQRDAATAASVAIAITSGASIVRVHDAAACRDAVLLADAVARADQGGASFGA